MKSQHLRDLENTKGSIESTIDKLRFEIKRLIHVPRHREKYAQIELKVKDATIKALEKRLELFTDNSTKMKAILRVPRLTK